MLENRCMVNFASTVIPGTLRMSVENVTTLYFPIKLKKFKVSMPKYVKSKFPFLRLGWLFPSKMLYLDQILLSCSCSFHMAHYIAVTCQNIWYDTSVRTWPSKNSHSSPINVHFWNGMGHECQRSFHFFWLLVEWCSFSILLLIHSTILRCLVPAGANIHLYPAITG